MKIGDMLVRAGLLTEEQLQLALADQRRWGGRLGEILIEKKFCSEDVIIRALSKQLGIKRAEFREIPSFPPAVVGRLPYPMACELNVAPYEYLEEERTLVVAITDPRDHATLEHLAKRTGWKVVPAIASAAALVRARAKIYNVKDEALLDAEDEGLKFTDAQGRTLVRSVEELERERNERRAAKEALARAEAAPARVPPARAPAEEVRAKAPAARSEEIAGFTDKKGRTLIRSIEAIREEARARGKLPAEDKGRADADGQPSRAELMVAIEALQNEVQALKAVAVVLFKKGLLSYEEYQDQVNKRAP